VEAALSDTDNTVIGTALTFVLPHFPPLLLAAMFKGAIKHGLKCAGISNEDARLMFGFGFVVCAVKVQSPNIALRAIRETLADMQILEQCEIAFADSEKKVWRTIHPAREAEPFERFLTEANCKLALEAVWAEVRLAELLLQTPQQLKQKGNDAQ
jgi:hypothetical protein